MTSRRSMNDRKASIKLSVNMIYIWTTYGWMVVTFVKWVFRRGVYNNNFLNKMLYYKIFNLSMGFWRAFQLLQNDEKLIFTIWYFIIIGYFKAFNHLIYINSIVCWNKCSYVNIEIYQTKIKFSKIKIF